VLNLDHTRADLALCGQFLKARERALLSESA